MNLIEYRRKMALQEREIAEYKWLKSEQKGYDIGAEQAILDWSGNGEAIRFNETYQSHKGDIMIKCNTTCGEGRCGAESLEGMPTYIKPCILEISSIHQLLEDGE